MPNGVILKYSAVLERYEGGPIIDSMDLDGNVFTTNFTLALGKVYDEGDIHDTPVSLYSRQGVAW